MPVALQKRAATKISGRHAFALRSVSTVRCIRRNSSHVTACVKQETEHKIKFE
jgi:hypothetical protein